MRQEFILLSDVLGASMQMINVNNEAHADATEATVVGPFFVDGRRDAVFGVKESLIKSFERHPAGTPTPDGRAFDGAWSRVRFDIVLAPVGT